MWTCTLKYCSYSGFSLSLSSLENIVYNIVRVTGTLRLASTSGEPLGEEIYDLQASSRLLVRLDKDMNTFREKMSHK